MQYTYEVGGAQCNIPFLLPTNAFPTWLLNILYECTCLYIMTVYFAICLLNVTHSSLT